jgi:hypothetical protein
MIPTLEVTFEKINFPTHVNKSSITNMTMESFPLSLCKGGASLGLKPFRDLRFVPKACKFKKGFNCSKYPRVGKFGRDDFELF